MTTRNEDGRPQAASPRTSYKTASRRLIGLDGASARAAGYALTLLLTGPLAGDEPPGSPLWAEAARIAVGDFGPVADPAEGGGLGG